MSSISVLSFYILSVKRISPQFFVLQGMLLDKTWYANNENTVVLGRMSRSILSSFLGIEGQYGPPPSLRSGDRPVLPLNSSEWWQYWPRHPPQNYSIPPLLACQFLVSNMWSTTYFPISCRGLVTKIALLQYSIEDMLLKLKNLNTPYEDMY